MGWQKTKLGDASVEVYVATLSRGGGTSTYWYDKERWLVRVTSTGQSHYLKRK